MAWTLLIIPQGCIPYHDIPSMPTPFAVSMTALSRDLSRCNLGHKTELFSQCHAKVQNLLQFANTFTTFNDKRKANKKPPTNLTIGRRHTFKNKIIKFNLQSSAKLKKKRMWGAFLLQKHA